MVSENKKNLEALRITTWILQSDLHVDAQVQQLFLLFSEGLMECECGEFARVISIKEQLLNWHCLHCGKTMTTIKIGDIRK